MGIFFFTPFNLVIKSFFFEDLDLSDPWGRALLQLFGGGKIGRQGVGVGYWLLKYDLIPITKSLYSISFFSAEHC